MCRVFLWHGGDETKTAALVAWKKICVPRVEGGLGIKQLRTWNEAALCKHLWTILTVPSSLWSKWVHINYLKGSSLWAFREPQDCSWAIRKLLQLRDKLKKAIKVKIGDGRETSLFYDWWCGEDRIADMEGMNTAIHWEKLRVGEWRENEAWKIPSSFRRRWPSIAKLIEDQQIYNCSDRVIWSHTESGLYTVASAYEAFRHKEEKVQ